MSHPEREHQPNNLPPLIEQLGRFVEAPKPGERPLVYFATRQSDFDYPERDQSKPNLYRADQITTEEFMAEVFPYSEYGDYRDLKKAEEWVMPGFDCYVVPVELDRSAQDWSFAGELAGVLKPMILGSGPNWDEAIDEALGVEKPEDENQAMVEGVQKHMATLLPIFQNAGPLDLPHYHASVCFALDNYAQEWLGLASYQVGGTEEEGKTPVEIFNERYGQYDLRYGRMMTVRYTSYKPGMLDALQFQLQEAAIRELGVEPDLLQERAAAVADKLSELQEDEDFAAFWNEHTGVKDTNEVELIGEYLNQLADNHPQKETVQELLDQISGLYQVAEQADELARQHFGEITQAYFGLSSDEFEQAYRRRLEWLIKEKDKALVEMAQRLGVSAMFERNSYDTGWFRPMSIEDFPAGGIILKQNSDTRFEGKPSRMIVAYPAVNPIEDLPTIARGQFSGALDEIAKDSNTPVVVTNDQELNQLRDQYVEGQLKYRSQYQSFSTEQILSGQVTAESISDSTEILFVTGVNGQQAENDHELQAFVLEAWKKIFRGERRTGVGPRVVIFASEEADLSWLPEGSKKGHLAKGEREVIAETIA